MSRGTSYDELYNALGAIALSSTGRKWWRKAGIQARPNYPYAVIYIVEADGLENQVVESVELDQPGDNGESFQQKPWGAATLDVTVEFYQDKAGDTALEAATRFRNSLRLEERFWDIWEIAGLAGGVRLIDISSIFRADIEPRTELRFKLNANISEPDALVDKIHEITSQRVDVTHVRQDGEETDIPVDIDNENP